jgi:hypothetical protein
MKSAHFTKTSQKKTDNQKLFCIVRFNTPDDIELPGLVRVAERRTSDVFNGPDLAGERDDVGGVPNELERRGAVEPGRNRRKRAVGIDPHE